jgi:hypothetical protein
VDGWRNAVREPRCGSFHSPLLIDAGNICRALCGVAAGASRAALMTHFAKKVRWTDVGGGEGTWRAVALFSNGDGADDF